MPMLENDVSDAILDLLLYADQRSDLAPEMRRHVERLRDLRQRIESGESMDLLEWDGDEKEAADAG